MNGVGVNKSEQKAFDKWMDSLTEFDHDCASVWPHIVKKAAEFGLNYKKRSGPKEHGKKD